MRWNVGDISSKGLDFIKRKEGYFDKAYLCPASVWTIGWGSIRWDAKTPVKKGDVCTVEQAERLLLKEVQRVEDAIDATIKVPLTQGMYDSLCSLFYNIGIGWLTGQGHPQATLVKLLNKGQYERIPSEILKFKMANGKPLAGLLKRRQEEVRELWLGDYDSPAPARVIETDPAEAPMPQSVEPEIPSAKGLIRESRTLQGIIAAAVAYVGEKAVSGYEFAFGVAKEAGGEILALKTTVSPLEPLLKVGLPAIVMVGICIAISRRVSARKEGREG
jgi:lysozyme